MYLYVCYIFIFRKRKFKKMIVDPDIKFSSRMTSSCSYNSNSVKKRNTRHSASMPRYNILKYFYNYNNCLLDNNRLIIKIFVTLLI